MLSTPRDSHISFSVDPHVRETDACVGRLGQPATGYRASTEKDAVGVHVLVGKKGPEKWKPWG